jgi:undecaprenyl-diphosphatase
MTASFPSGHSMLSAVFFLTLGGLMALYTGQKRLKGYILTLSIPGTFLVGCSRVYLGVHLNFFSCLNLHKPDTGKHVVPVSG